MLKRSYRLNLIKGRSAIDELFPDSHPKLIVFRSSELDFCWGSGHELWVYGLFSSGEVLCTSQTIRKTGASYAHVLCSSQRANPRVWNQTLTIQDTLKIINQCLRALYSLWDYRKLQKMRSTKMAMRQFETFSPLLRLQSLEVKYINLTDGQSTHSCRLEHLHYGGRRHSSAGSEPVYSTSWYVLNSERRNNRQVYTQILYALVSSR
jgi:hypothetical protein